MKRKFFLFIIPVGLLATGLTALQPATSPEVPPAPELRYLSSHLTQISSDPPADLSFAGQLVPLQNEAVKSRLVQEMGRHFRYQVGVQLMLKRSLRYQEAFLNILRAKGVPEDFFYLAVAESGLSNAISPVGAKGFWQFMPATARAYGLEVSATVDERFDPLKATYAACEYLLDNYRQFGDWNLVAAAYNMGPTRLRAAIKRQDTADYFALELNRETAGYLYRILTYKTLLEQPARYGIQTVQDARYAPIPHYRIKVRTSIPDLSAFAKKHGTNFATLKLLNPWLVAGSLQVRPGKTYALQLPKGGLEAFVAAELRIHTPYALASARKAKSESESDSMVMDADTVEKIEALARQPQSPEVAPAVAPKAVPGMQIKSAPAPAKSEAGA